jgi:hypothetical protein
LQAQDLQYIKKEMVSYYYLESDPLFVGRDKSFKDIHQDLVKERKDIQIDYETKLENYKSKRDKINADIRSAKFKIEGNESSIEFTKEHHLGLADRSPKDFREEIRQNAYNRIGQLKYEIDQYEKEIEKLEKELVDHKETKPVKPETKQLDSKIKIYDLLVDFEHHYTNGVLKIREDIRKRNCVDVDEKIKNLDELFINHKNHTKLFEYRLKQMNGLRGQCDMNIQNFSNLMNLSEMNKGKKIGKGKVDKLQVQYRSFLDQQNTDFEIDSNLLKVIEKVMSETQIQKGDHHTLRSEHYSDIKYLLKQNLVEVYDWVEDAPNIKSVADAAFKDYVGNEEHLLSINTQKLQRAIEFMSSSATGFSFSKSKHRQTPKLCDGIENSTKVIEDDLKQVNEKLAQMQAYFEYCEDLNSKLSKVHEYINDNARGSESKAFIKEFGEKPGLMVAPEN